MFMQNSLHNKKVCINSIFIHNDFYRANGISWYASPKFSDSWFFSHTHCKVCPQLLVLQPLTWLSTLKGLFENEDGQDSYPLSCLSYPSCFRPTVGHKCDHKDTWTGEDDLLLNIREWLKNWQVLCVSMQFLRFMQSDLHDTHICIILTSCLVIYQII